jgi:hypothetical protein
VQQVALLEFVWEKNDESEIPTTYNFLLFVDLDGLCHLGFCPSRLGGKHEQSTSSTCTFRPLGGAGERNTHVTKKM